MNQISVSQKMGVKEGMRTFFLNAPEPILNAINLPGLDVGSALQGELEYLHLFTKTQLEWTIYFQHLNGISSRKECSGCRGPRAKNWGLALPCLPSFASAIAMDW